jgi:hypothetical protein
LKKKKNKIPFTKHTSCLTWASFSLGEGPRMRPKIVEEKEK